MPSWLKAHWHTWHPTTLRESTQYTWKSLIYYHYWDISRVLYNTRSSEVINCPTCRLYWSHLIDVSSVAPFSVLPLVPWWPVRGTGAAEILWCLSSVCGLAGGLLLLRTSCWSDLSSSVEGSVIVSTGVRRRFVGESLDWRWPSKDEVEVLLYCLLAVEFLDPLPSLITSMRGFAGNTLLWICR
jgi:hypothetical protein